MEALEKEHDHLMGFYFSCPHCQQKYVSAECVQEHWNTCQMQSSSFMIPQIQSYSSLNPQAFDVNFDSGGFPIQHEIIKKEPEDYMEDDNTDWQADETEDSTLSNPAEEIPEAEDDAPNPRKLRPRLPRENVEIFYDSDETVDSDSSQDVPDPWEARPFSKVLRISHKNPSSTSTEDRYLCRYCPRTFPYRGSVYQHEASHTRDPNYSCSTCGVRFHRHDYLIHHMKSHKPDLEFHCRYPGCPRSFRHQSSRWYHHTKHPKGQWNEDSRWSRKLRKIHKSNTVSEAVILEKEDCVGNYNITKQTTDHSIQETTTTEENDTSKNARMTRSGHSIESYDPAQAVSCLFPGCPKTFASKLKRWIHHKTHPKGRWNRSGRRPVWRLLQNQKTLQMPPILTPANENFTDNESVETSSMPDLTIEGPMTLSESNPVENNIQQSAENDDTPSQESRGPNNPTVRKRGRPAKPGHEIEIMTAWGRRFKCDLCDKMFPARTVVRNHRLSHFDEPQFSCYITGCSQMFFSRVQRVSHLKSVHRIRFRKGKPFIGTRRVAVNIPGPRNSIAKAIVRNVNAARQPSQSPQKILPNASPKSYQNAPRGSQTEGLSSGRTELFPCGLCDGSFDNLDILKYHMMTIHKEELQAPESAEIGTPAKNESMETLSLPDFSIKRRITHSETKSANNPELDNVRQSAAINGAILLESRDSNILRTNRKRGPPSRPGAEIEIITAWGKRFKCDVCDSVFLTRTIAKDHRLLHYDDPQIPCYMTGCYEKFFSRAQRVNHLKAVHRVIFRKGKPFLGTKLLALKITAPRKVIAKEIISNFHAARQPSQSPQKIQLKEATKPHQNIPRRSEAGGFSPGETALHTCGICDDSFENFYDLKCHMLTTHAGPEDPQTVELEEIPTPCDSSLGRVQSTCERDQMPLEVKQNEASSNLPDKNLTARIQQKGPVLRYPIVEVGGKKYFCCGFPGCDAVFNDRIERYKHQKKCHNDAPCTMFTCLPVRLSEKKANDTSSTQLRENSDDEKKKTADNDSVPDFPFVEVNGKKYFWCDFPDCAVVTTNVEARYLHHKKHEMSSAETTKTTIAQSSVVLDPKKRKLAQKEPKQLQMKRPKIAERNKDWGQTLLPNQPELSEFSMQYDGELSAQSPTQVLDQDFEADGPEMPDLHNQSVDKVQFIATDDDNSPIEYISLFNGDFNAENIAQTDSGLDSELSPEASNSSSNPALRNISHPIDKVDQPPPLDQKRKSIGRPRLYPQIQIGARKLFCCNFPGCTGVFNRPKTLYLHTTKHRMGKRVKPKLKLTEDGMVLDSAEGSFLMQ